METASTSGRPPLPHQSQTSLLRAASSFKEKSPAMYRNLSVDGTKIYESIQNPPEEKSTVESASTSSSPHSTSSISSSSVSSSSSICSSSMPSSSSSISPSSSGRIEYPRLQESPSLKESTPRSSSSSSSLQRRSSVDQAVKGSTPGAVSPTPPPFIPRRLLQSSSAVKMPHTSFNILRKEIGDTWDRVFLHGINTDVTIYTDDGYELYAHSMILMCSSPVLKYLLSAEFRRSSRAFVNFHGVPFHAVRCFVRFLYSSRCEPADMEMFAIHLLVLAHAYMVPTLKRLCTDSFEHGLLDSDNVVDTLQVARLCDAPRLHMLCLRRIVSDFKTIARSEAWRVMKEAEPALEQELVEAMIEAETKRRDRVRKQEEDKVYSQLHDAMEALVHICRDGCRSIGPHDKALDEQRGACAYPACKGLESLVRHFAACKLKVSGGCVHCKRMWQLLELHSRMCTLPDASCKVPLCKAPKGSHVTHGCLEVEGVGSKMHFQERVGGQPSRKEEMRWRMLVKKVQGSTRAAPGPFSLTAVTARLSQVQ